MTDEPMTNGEIQRALERHDRALMNVVTTDQFLREGERLRSEIRDAVSDCKERTDDVEKTAMDAVKELKEGKQNAWSRTLQITGIVVAIAAAYIAAKGIK